MVDNVDSMMSLSSRLAVVAVVVAVRVADAAVTVDDAGPNVDAREGTTTPRWVRVVRKRPPRVPMPRHGRPPHPPTRARADTPPNVIVDEMMPRRRGGVITTTRNDDPPSGLV
jgi:hypothetical protein